MFPGLLVAFGASTGKRQILEVQRRRIRTTLDAPLQRFSKTFDRNAPSLGLRAAMETADELRVDRQSSHSTPVRWSTCLHTVARLRTASGGVSMWVRIVRL